MAQLHVFSLKPSYMGSFVFVSLSKNLAMFSGKGVIRKNKMKWHLEFKVI